MLRFGLLGGERWTPPWEFFVTIGAALLGTAVLFVPLFPLWSTYPVLGLAETGAFAGAGGILLAVGLRRRKRSLTGSGAASRKPPTVAR